MYKYIWIAFVFIMVEACKVPYAVRNKENRTVPANFGSIQDTTSNTGKIKWKDFFTDANLAALIDSALKNNQELNIILQDINIAKNEAISRKGTYLPFLGVIGGAGVEKSSRYTRDGSVDDNANVPITSSGKPIPQVLPDYLLAANVSWEVDIWKKLRNSRKSAIYRFLSTTEGKNFMVTRLVAEIANSYYELMSLDNQLSILKNYIEIQQDALEMVKIEKANARSTELAVRRFTAEVQKNQGRQYYIQQQIIETENHINFLVGRFPQPVQRSSQTFPDLKPDSIHTGTPSQLLENRPDIRQAEKELAAAKLDVKSAKAYFYPSLVVSAAVGIDAFSPAYLFKAPESILYSLAGGLMAPIINRNAIKANYYSASSRQVQAIYGYEKTVLNAYVEVANRLAKINNLRKSYDFKSQQVQSLTQSITISINLFKSARADYMDVLFTQRDALDAKMELIETKKLQMNAMVNIYQALGGGWN